MRGQYSRFGRVSYEIVMDETLFIRSLGWVKRFWVS